MGRNQVRRGLVVAIAVGIRGTRALKKSCGPQLRLAVRAVVRLAGGEGEHAEILAAHVVVAVAGGVALTALAAVAQGPTSQLCKVARTALMGAVAVSAVVVLVRRAGGKAERARMRPLIARAAHRLTASSASAPAARALQVACDPRLLWTGHDSLRPALRYAARKTVSRLAIEPVVTCTPGLGWALEIIDGYRTTAQSARFVREFALAALELRLQHLDSATSA
jgi:hypothetical protein